MFYGKLTHTTIPKILSVSLLATKEHPCKVKKNLQGSSFIIYDKVGKMKPQLSHIGVLICYQNVDAEK